MEHISGFGLENFRVFKHKVHFDFAPLTILTGTNNSGKSTVINALKLLKENFKDFEEDKNDIYLNIDQLFSKNINVHSLIDRYGPLNQFTSNGSQKGEFKFSFRHKMIAIDDTMEVTCTVKLYDKEIKAGRITDVLIRSINKDKDIFHVYEKERQLQENEDKIEKGSKKSKGKANQLAEYIEKYAKAFPYPKDGKIITSVIKINLSYFYDQLIERVNKNIDYFKDRNLVLKGEMPLEELNNKYNTDFIWVEQFNGSQILMLKGEDPDEEPDFVVGYDIIHSKESLTRRSQLEHIVNELNNNIFYDFRFLLKKKIEQGTTFSKILRDYYTRDINKSLASFNLDIIKFLSEIEWISFTETEDLGWSPLSTLDALSKKKTFTTVEENNFGLSLTRFLNSFCLGSTPSRTRWGGMKIEEDKLQDVISTHRAFYDNIFKPFTDVIVEQKGKDETKELNWESAYISESFRKSISEKTMYKMIYDNINVISEFLNKVKDIEFLSANRVIPKRVYSFADKDLLSNKIKWIGNLDEAQGDEINIFLNKWIKEFGLGDRFIVVPDKDTANFKAYVENGNERILFADLGRGATQLLQVLLMVVPQFNEDKEDAYIWGNKFNHQIITIEEPEANLHPALQSLLADMFVEAGKKFKIQLIIETHSEYLIRKLQYLTAREEIDDDFTQIYYFYHPDNILPGEKQVVKININKDGSLTNDFGSGFFDESDKIEMTIWNLNQSQKN